MGYKGQNDLNGSFGDGDWAYHNAISNGGNKAHLWRTLTRDEWNYLFYQRKEALSKLFAGVMEAAVQLRNPFPHVGQH